MTRARAMAARCASPPDSSRGRWSARAARPTRSRARERARAPLGGRRALVEERRLDVLRHRELRDQVEGLEHEADRAVAQAGELVVAEPLDAPPVEEVLAPGRAVEAAEDREQRRLARARGAHDRELLALADLEAHPGERHHLRGPARVDAGHVAQGDERRGAQDPGAPLKSGRAASGSRSRTRSPRERPFSITTKSALEGPSTTSRGRGPAPGDVDDAAAVPLEDGLERHEEGLRPLLHLDLDPGGHAGAQARLRLVHLHGHREELRAAPLLLLLGERADAG